MTTINDCDFSERFEMALEWLRVQYERRDQFLSDSDVLDAAEMFTSDVRDEEDGYPENGDYYELQGALFALLCEAFEATDDGFDGPCVPLCEADAGCVDEAIGWECWDEESGQFSYVCKAHATDKLISFGDR